MVADSRALGELLRKRGYGHHGRRPIGLVDQIVARILVDVCELEDRSSPDETPEMMLVSGEELDMIVRRALEEAGVR
jgi:hypothetical protein